MATQCSIHTCNTISDVRQVLKKIQYENVKFSAVKVKEESWKIKFKIKAKCNYTEENITIEVTSTSVQKLPHDSSEAIRAVIDIILWWECHEALERFRYDGQMILDPHSKWTENPIKEKVYLGRNTNTLILDSVKHKVNVAG